MSKALAIVGGVLTVGLLAGAGYYGITHLGIPDASPSSSASEVPAQDPTPATDTGAVVVDPDAAGAAVATDAVLTAEDELAMNDLDMVAMGQATALSATGKIVTDLSELSALGVEAQLASAVMLLPSEDMKHYAAVAMSGSGKVFVRVDGGAAKQVAAIPNSYESAASAPAL